MLETYYFNGRRVVDAVAPDGRGFYSQKSREALEAEYGALTALPRAEAMAEQDKAASTLPEEIEQQDFIDALECLPPLKWRGSGQGMESFRISEPFDGTVHWSFVRIGNRFFKCRQPLATSHDDLCRLVVATFPEVRA